ncbi:putative P-loop-containing kinase [Thioflavicoccus mobilis 8321]|uniref:Putative P-loop-containing kinase n=1 Tax=Thioflavicoccus mobilis 8321 TaxID=765912 RepID=L0H1H8_9GAMM|nr:RNase adapter RapZ [Thioflavicoccus mobilis]AGA91475.1 putative P-loop-containing kinase [Thioflavicoccus mobilis 8321]
MKLIIISGLSGSGKSVALHTLEDVGYYCIDNLPLFLLAELTTRMGRSRDSIYARTAVGIDARNEPEDLHTLANVIAQARDLSVECRVAFLDAQTETLIKRFSETRRKHPLTSAERPLREAIDLERRFLEPILQVASLQIDTTHTNVHELRDLVREQVGGEASPRASILLQSFGFKNGVPHDVDFVFDVRCLPNPHWEPQLRERTGLDQAVTAFLEGHPEVIRMRDDILAFLNRWVPQFETDGRSYLTIAIGCTGGKHRSVYMANWLRRHFEQEGHKVMVRHRELP